MNLSAILKILENECCTKISVETLHEAFASWEELKLAPDQYLHSSSFCRGKKLADQNKSCAGYKKRTLPLAAGGKAFCRRCPHGVEELIQGVIFQGKLAAVCYFTLLPNTIPRKELYKKARWLGEYIHLLLKGTQMNEAPRRGSRETYRKRFLFYLDLHYMENISEGDLAGELGLHVTYVSTLFREVMGTTFRKALTHRRLHEAKIYLKLHKTLSISHIAHLCGFHDSNYFSSVFRHFTGLSPREFRNSVEKEEIECR